MLVPNRDCSAPFHLAPYRGKPPAPAEAPDALEAQKLLAGMADRGADVAVLECAAEGLEEGRFVLPTPESTLATSSMAPGDGAGCCNQAMLQPEA